MPKNKYAYQFILVEEESDKENKIMLLFSVFSNDCNKKDLQLNKTIEKL